MKTLAKSTAFVAIAILISGFTGSGHQLGKLSWLLGTWENNTQRGTMYETWKMVNPHEFAGKSYILKEKDTVVFETIRLVEEAGKVFYIPTVSGQNNSQPVRFPMKSMDEKSVVFENLQHDFPKVISYEKTGDKSLTATISDGKAKKQDFHMVRK